MARVDDAFYAEVLRRIGAPVNSATMQFMKLWQRFEGASATYNPFNTAMPVAGATSYRGMNVKNYPTREAGIEATVKTFTQRNAKAYGYHRIVTALRASNPAQAIQALINSSWASGHYGATRQRGGSYNPATAGIWKAFLAEGGSAAATAVEAVTNLPKKGTAWYDPKAGLYLDPSGKWWSKDTFQQYGPKGLKVVNNAKGMKAYQNAQSAGRDPGAVVDVGLGVVPGPSDALGMVLGGPDTLGVGAAVGSSPLAILSWLNDNKARVGLALLGVLVIVAAVVYSQRGTATQAINLIGKVKPI